jgi:hypothetical protein
LLPVAESGRFRQAVDDKGVSLKSLSLLRRGWRILSGYAFTFFSDVSRLWRELKYGRYDLLHVSGRVTGFVEFLRATQPATLGIDCVLVISFWRPLF